MLFFKKKGYIRRPPFPLVLFIPLLIGFCLLLFSAQEIKAATYYLDATGGNNSNTGTSTDQAWQTLDRIKGIDWSPGPATLSPGDQILLKRGETFVGQIYGVRAEGTANNPAIIGAYGTGADPIINGDIASSVSWNLVDGYADIYTALISNYDNGSIVSKIYEDTTALTKVAWCSCDLSNPVQFAAYMSTFNVGNWGGYNSGATNRIYVRTIDGLAPHDMRLVTSWGVDFWDGSTYGIIENIDIHDSNHGIYLTSTDNVIVRNNYIHNVYAIGIYLNQNNTNTLVNNNITDTTGNDGIYVYTGSNNTVSNNTINNVTNVINGFTVTGDQAGIGLQESQNNTVERNIIANIYTSGIDFSSENGSTIRYNNISNTGQGNSSGGFYPHGTDLSIYYNTIDSAGAAYGSNSNNTGSGYLNIYNNTFYDIKANGYALMNTTNNGSGHVTYRNNIVYVIGTGIKLVDFIPSTDSDYNLYYWETSGIFRYNSINYTSLGDFQTASDKDTNSVFANPLFTNPPSSIFALAPSSPAIDKGTNVGLTRDFIGTAVPLGTAPDIGAYEYIFPVPGGPSPCNDGVPGSAPLITSVVGKSINSILLVFSEASEPVTNYVLEYGTQSGKYQYSSANIGGKGTTNYTVNFLSPATTYYFRVRASNGCATGAWSSEVSGKTLSWGSGRQLETEIMEREEIESEEKIERVKVTVRVVDTNQVPIRGAKVILYSIPREVTTNKDGLAVFEDVEKGEHRIVINFQNQEGEEKVNLEKDAVSEYKFTIQIESTSPFRNTRVLFVIAVLGFSLVAALVRKRS